MINITLLPSGAMLIQRDGADILIAHDAIAQALPVALGVLIDNGRAVGLARKQGYEDGLTDGYQRCEREAAARARCAERSRAEDAEIETLFTLAA